MLGGGEPVIAERQVEGVSHALILSLRKDARVTGLEGVAVVVSCIVKIGGKQLQRPYRGSIGVIGSPSNIERQWGAIFDGSRWLIRAQAGFMPLVAPSLAIWSI